MMRKHPLLSLFVLICVIAISSSTTAASDLDKLLPNDGSAADRFGQSVAIYGSYIIVGAPYDDDNGTDSGSAYIFRNIDGNWIQQAKLSADDGSEGGFFGDAVAISDNFAIVAAPNDDDNGSNSGSAYIFIRSGENWTQQSKLTPNDGSPEDYFGSSIYISDDFAIIGADQDDDNGVDSGSVYIFARSGVTWMQQTKLYANDGSAGDRFGRSLSFSGSHAVIGAYGDDDNGSSSGSAYIFLKSGNSWTQQSKLTPNDGAENDYFGFSVSIFGSYVIAGAYGDDDNGSLSGSAYIFVRSGSNWTQQSKLTPSDGAEYDFFGFSTSISGNFANVGAFSDDDKGPDSGSSYIFKRSDQSWPQELKLTPDDGTGVELFGLPVFISGPYAIAGATGTDDNGSNSGAVYVYTESSWAKPTNLPWLPLILD